MAPVPDTNRRYSDEKLLPVRSPVIAAYLQLAGHPVVAIRCDSRRQEMRQHLYLFPATAQADFDRLMRALDTLRADAERVVGARR
jgi:hypothetical protein